MSIDYQEALEYKERVIRLLPIAKDFMANKEPEYVLEYTKSLYVLGLIIGRILLSK